MYRIKIIPAAQKDLDYFPSKQFRQITTAITKLSLNPRPPGNLKLTNEEGYRIRVGKYRILYRIDDHSKEIYIYRIKHRKDVYR